MLEVQSTEQLRIGETITITSIYDRAWCERDGELGCARNIGLLNEGHRVEDTGRAAGVGCLRFEL